MNLILIFIVCDFFKLINSKVVRLDNFKFHFDGNLELSSISTHSKIVMCPTDPYFMAPRMKVEDLPLKLCTHFFIETWFKNYTLSNFEDLNSNETAIEVREFRKRLLHHKKATSNSCKLILSVNSYKGDSGIHLMSLMGGDNDTQQSFIGDLLQNLEVNNLNGVNIEIYPNTNFLLLNKTNLESFIYALGSRLKEQNSTFILTLLPPFQIMLNYLSWNELTNFVDFVLFRFDFTYSPKSLGTIPTIGIRGVQNSVSQTVNLAIRVNITRKKLIIGNPTYNIEYVRASYNTIPVFGEAYIKITDNNMAYYKVCRHGLQKTLDWKFYFDDVTESTFMTAGSKLISFSSPFQIEHLGKYVMKTDLAGVAIWGVMTEDSQGHTCDIRNNISFSILRSLNHAFSIGLNEHEYLAGNKGFYWILGGCVFVVLTGLIIMSVVIIYYKRTIISDSQKIEFYAGSGSLLTADLQKFYENFGDPTINKHVRYDKALEISASKFQIDKTSILGRGSYGTVYKGNVENIVVAVKMINKFLPSHEDITSFLDEIRIMSSVGSCKYLLSLIGANTSQMQKGKLFAFMEFCPLGSLKTLLESNRDQFANLAAPCMTMDSDCEAENPDFKEKPLSLLDLHIWSHQISTGMEYLSSINIIHGDLATRNILLFSRNCIKISDFGLSRNLYTYCVYKKTKKDPLPWRWMAIESLRDLEFSVKSDVWSFGVTLWELFSLAETPYKGIPWSPSFVMLLLNGLQLQKPPYSDTNTTILECMSKNPDERPDFVEISKALAVNLTP